MKKTIPDRIVSVLKEYYGDILDITRYTYFQKEEDGYINHKLVYYIKDQLEFNYQLQTNNIDAEHKFAFYLLLELERTRLEKRNLTTIEDQERIDLANNS